MGLKLDMSKAYDRVEWLFLEKMMLKLGFPLCFTRLVMKCVETATFSVLVNGQPSRQFKPSRGLRQGDPLSPFLFVLCAEGLSTLLRDAEEQKLIHGVKIGRRVNPISHLFFADDILLFIRATEEEVDNVLEVLSTYEAASGQKLNMEKSEMSYSRNIEPEKINILQMKLSFKAVEGHEKYLGLPTFIGSSKKRIFQSIQDRVWKKLKGWKGQCLSQAGREVLIKAIAQAIPSYAMQCFKIPKSIIDGIERMCRSFFWGQKEEEKKMAWVAWEKMFLPKKEGGMGIRNFEVFNRALLAKQAWRILTMPNSLMTRVLKSKYFPSKTFLEAQVTSNMSFTWRSILSAKQVISKVLCRVVGDGTNTNIWHDPWVPGLPNCRVKPRGREVGESDPQRVSELMENGGWKVEVLNNLFSSTESMAIQSIPLPKYTTNDEWMWYHKPNGKFTVRSAYFVELQSASREKASASGKPNNTVWKQLWDANVPPKVKMFGWRLLRNGLPVNSNLARRGMDVSRVCQRCGGGDETLEHMMMHCVESSRVWYFSPLRLEPPEVGRGTFRDWVEFLLASKREGEWWVLFWMLCWNIWLGRNGWVFERKPFSFMEVAKRATKGALEFTLAAEKGQRNEVRNELEVKWCAPREGVYKLNTDAAMIKNKGIGMGGVVRDREGDVMMATCCGMVGISNVDVAEALSVRHGLQVAVEAGLRNLIVEVDCRKLFNHLQARIREVSPFGKIVADILDYASNCYSISFSHVKRQGNKVAHILAQQCKAVMELRVWLEEVPYEVINAVIFDKSSA